MTIYAGLDVSDKTTHICVVDGTGAIVWRGVCASDPEVVAKTLRREARGLSRVVLETGPLSTFLYHGLIEREVPVLCICARHAKGVLSARINKSDPHDAEGLAQLARTGWYKAVRIKGEATHLDRAQLKIREQLVMAHRAMANQLRGLLKLFGLRLGKVTTPNKRAERLRALFAQKPEIAPVMRPLIESLEAIEGQIRRATRLLAATAEADPVAARLMTVPGVGPLTALIFKSSIEDPGRFACGRDAGAFAGLTPRRTQSGERDHRGRITKAGDPMLRSALYEAANNLLARVKRPCALQTWGRRLAETRGAKRARVAVARKLAILLHTLWRSEKEFCWA
ncbi:IS110 family transposase [Sphingomonas oligophenolica]|uniref:IS110 family transposase n=1 Tax=Sphingomonas oligophenolica TaxID=301154 RepID=A0ABU9XXE6_9SPHN